jgi:hypothetical protein
MMAQVVLTTPGTPQTINFAGFTATGFTTSPAAGQLSSNTWSIKGFTDGTLPLGGSATTGDLARGVLAAPGTTSGGLYAINNAGTDVMWFQPTGADFSPGELIMAVQNNSGAPMQALDLSYDIFVFNDQGRANSFNLGFAVDTAGPFSNVASFDYVTPEVADAAPSVQIVNKSGQISGFNVPNGGFLYIRWESNDVTGAGSRDEFGISNISVAISSATPNPFFNLAQSTLTVNESAGTVDVTVSITTAANCSVNLVLNPASTATSADFTFTSPTTLTFTAAGATTQTVSIPVLNNTVTEVPETIILDLQATTGGCTIGSVGSTTITILDDDVQAVTGLVITEIMYNDPSGGTAGDSLEYVELYNNSGATLDLTGVTFSLGITHTFAAGTSLAADDYLILARNAAAMQNVFGAGLNLVQWNGGQLTNTGEPIVIRDALNNIVDSVSYLPSAPWPTSPNGLGTSLILCNPNADNSIGSNWSAATTAVGVQVNLIDLFANPGDTDAACVPPGALSLGFDGTTISVDENVGTVTVSVLINNPDPANATTVQVVLDAAASTATSGTDFTFTSPATLTFAAGDTTPQVVTVTIVDDIDFETAETVVLNLLNATNGALITNDSVYTITINGNDATAVTDIVITEIMFNDPFSVDSLEFIELYNAGNGPANLLGCTMLGVTYTFPAVTLNAGEYLTIAFNASAFSSVFGTTPLQWTTGALSNNGEAVALYDALGNLVDSVFYDDVAPWPLAADGAGYSMVLVDPNTDNADGANWCASATFAGTISLGDTIYANPGGADSCSTVAVTELVLEALQIFPNPANEQVFIQHQGIQTLKVELFDITGRPVYQAISNSNNMTIQTNQLAAGMYLIRLSDVQSGQALLRKLIVE